MKKITAFFMAILPFLVVLILFATGLIVKDAKHLYVRSLECIEDSLTIQQKTDVAEEFDVSKNVNVIPAAASNPALFYTSDDADIIQVDYTSGKAKATGFGTTNINIKSQENPSIGTKCRVTIWDDKVHKINVDNKAQASFVPCNTTIQLATSTIPSLPNEKLTYSVDKASEPLISVDSNGKFVTGTTPGTATISITSSDKRVTVNHKVYIGDMVEKVYFDDPATTIVSYSSYDLSKHVHTAPYDIASDSSMKPSDYLTFSSSNPLVASIDENGIITFRQQIDADNIPTFTVTLKGTLLSTSKRISSTMEYFVDVNFNKYNYVTELNSETINKPLNETEFNWSVYPAQTKTTKPVVLESSNTSVVEVKDGKFYVKGAGQTVLTVTVETSEGATKSDRCFVTVLDPSVSVLNKDALTLTNTYYLPLGQYVNDQFKNQKIEWSITDGGDIAKIDQHGIVNFSEDGEITVQAKCGENASTIKLTCSYSEETTVITIDDLESTTYKAKVGKKVQFQDKNGGVITPGFSDEQKAKLTIDDEKNTYILNAGSEEVWEVYCSEEPLETDTFNFVIEEDAIGVSPITPELWPYYTTNASIVDVSQIVTVYPSTATKENGDKITPEYEITLQEGSISKVVDTTITFAKPEYADVKVKFNDQTYEYGIKSQFGLYGKFSLTDDDTVIQSGKTYNLKSGETKTLKVDDFIITGLPTEPTEEEMKERFRIESLNSGTVVTDLQTNYDEDEKELTFSFTAKDIGNDIIVICNDTFRFVINVNVTNTIQSFELYNSDGTKIEQNTEESPISSYSKDLNLFVLTNLGSTKSDKYTVEWNDVEISASSFINLKDVDWKDGANKLTLTSKDDTNVSATYYLQYKDSISDFTIEESAKEGDKNFVYVQAGSTIATMTIKISNGLASPSFFKDNFKYTIDGKEQQVDSNLINVSLPAATDANPGYEKEVTVTCTSGTTKSYNYTISRDLVSKIVLPDHNNDEDNDKKGMQKVHVFGNKSYYDATEKEIDGYRLPIDIYNYKGVKVEDNSEKETLYKTLRTSMKTHDAKVLSGASVTYEQGHLKVMFDSNSLYTNDEIYNDAFANESKNQIINIATNWGYYNANKPKGTNANVKYSFVAVEGINCYVQEALIWPTDDKNLVLQTNFGLEGATKENQPFDKALNFNGCNSLHGNGYSINFDARASLTDRNQIHFQYLLNTHMFCCNNEKYQKLQRSSADVVSFTAKDIYMRYDIFQNYFEVMHLNEPNYNSYLKNSVFYNNKNNCIGVASENQKTYIENCGFFKCSNIALTLKNKASLYLKGSIDVYNFVNSEIFKNIEGHDLSFLWPVVEPMFREANMLQTGPDGREYVNSYSFSILNDNVYFYKGKDAEGKDIYSLDETGSPLAANHLAKGFEISLPFVGNIRAWTTRNPQTETGAPSYYDEFDEHGNVNTWKLTELILKLSRQI